MLTIREAVGDEAPAPRFVTSDFVRRGELLLAVPCATEATNHDAGAEDARRAVWHAAIDLTSSSYSPYYREGSCVDLSK